MQVRKYTEQNRQKLFRGIIRAISSYLIVFLVPFLAVSWIWYDTSVKSINEQVLLTARNQLIQLKYSLENTFIQLNYLTQKMTNDHVVSLKYLQHPYLTKEAKEAMQTYKITNDLVEEVYLYYKEAPATLYSTVGSLSVDTFLNKVLPKNDMDQVQLVAQLDSPAPTLLTLEGAGGEQRYSRFFYIVPIQSEEMTVYGAAIYEIKENNLKRILDLSNSDGLSNTYIINDEYQLLASTTNDELARFLNHPERMKKGIQTGRMRFEQSTYFVQAITNKELNISVVAVANPNQALASVNRVQEQFVLVFIAILFTGITAVVMLGLRSYRPIRKIENLVQEFHRDPKMTLHSMDDVHNTLAAFLVEHQELHQEVRLQTPHAREQVLRKLMSGRFRSEQELALLLEAVHVCFPKSNYFVIAIDTKTVDTKAKQGDKKFLIDYIEEIKEADYTAYATEILSTEMLALTVGFVDGKEQKEIVDAIAEKITQAISLTPAMGVGMTVDQLTAINESYIEGLAALENQGSQGKQISYYAELSQETKHLPINYPDNQKLKLIQALNQGNIEIASETIQRLIEEGESKQTSPRVQKMYGYYLLNTIAQVGGELVGAEVLHTASESADFNSLNQLQTALLTIAQQICTKVQKQPLDDESEMNEKIFSFIQENYHSSQLSLESVAEEVGVSVSYVSRFVKKESGKTFSKYIQELRLKKIKEELIETDLPIKEIIRNNGYYDVSNYTRKFRKIVGVTPGQYREMNQKMRNY